MEIHWFGTWTPEEVEQTIVRLTPMAIKYDVGVFFRDGARSCFMKKRKLSAC